MLRANSKNWLLSLPLALLALRMIPSGATDTAPFTLVTGSAIHLPANYLNHGLQKFTEKNFVSDLAQNLSSVQFAEPKWHRNQNTYVPRELQSCSKVWIRTDRVKKPLEAPYSGPVEVVERHKNFFVIRYLDGSKDTVTIKRLKPFIERKLPSVVQNPIKIATFYDDPPEPPPVLDDDHVEDDVADPHEIVDEQIRNLPNHVKFERKIPFTTRSGRQVKFSDKNQILFIEKIGHRKVPRK